MDFKAIATKWQSRWKDAKAFKTRERKSKSKFYCLEMFPYPSGKLHMGHVRNYSLTDSFARYQRMLGNNVLYPPGYDALGLPAENAAIKRDSHPKEWTYKCIEMMREQQEQMGFSYDWERMFATCDPQYYRWNQWIFLKMFEKGLAYKKKSPINWCDSCSTVLANEQVVDGKCWRCDNEITIKELDQWFIRITDYAQQLLDDLKLLHKWPERVKAMQENWIGRSEGTLVKFKIDGSDEHLEVFTTRPDTLYGCTFMSLAPEHPMTLELSKGTSQESEVRKFVDKVLIYEKHNRQEGKEGVFTGAYAINPVTGKKIPVYTANFVLMDYGTGAVMAVPAHDQRDYEFAKKYDIPVKTVIESKETQDRAYEGDGKLVDSGEFTGMHNRDAIAAITKHLESLGLGKSTVQYKLRDWLVSRQRYWGTPIPIVYCDDCGLVPVPVTKLPVELPDDVSFTGQGNPLATSQKFMKVRCPRCGKKAHRETDTMDTFFDSSWYFFRFTSPKYSKLPFDPARAATWMPVDQYVGGIEHAILHLLYARFFTKFLRDEGLTKLDEPFPSLLCQGMVTLGGAAMSKSKGNVVDPGEIIERFGPDTARAFILSAASPEKQLEWSTKGVESTYRLLQRVYRLSEPYVSENSSKDKLLKSRTHSTIRACTLALDELRANDAVFALQEFVSFIHKWKPHFSERAYKKAVETLTLLFSPFAPHLAEEMWERLGNRPFCSLAKWPKLNENFIKPELEYVDTLVDNVSSDIRTVMELAKVERPSAIQVIVADKWKSEFYEHFKHLYAGTKNPGQILQSLMQTGLKSHGQQISKIVPALVKNPGRIPEVILSQQQEMKALKESRFMFEGEFGCTVHVVKESQSKEAKARQAMPGKPAIIVK